MPQILPEHPVSFNLDLGGGNCGAYLVILQTVCTCLLQVMFKHAVANEGPLGLQLGVMVVTLQAVGACVSQVMLRHHVTTGGVAWG